MEIYSNNSLTAKWENRVKDFLSEMEIEREDALDFTVILLEDGKIIGTGARKKNILKYIAVSCEQQGNGLASIVLTELMKNAYAKGFFHLFLYTSPNKIELFENLGFYLITKTEEVALLENKKNGIQEYLNFILEDKEKGRIGCIVAHCNPFTLGHYYLAECASKECDFIYFLVLSEDSGSFPPEDRLFLAKKSLESLSNVKVCSTANYLISMATFPDYFLKDKKTGECAYYDLDLAVFTKFFVKVLNISKRYVGTEPVDLVTKGYNERMKEVLPFHGVQVEEILRKSFHGEIISASMVRKQIKEGNKGKIFNVVPQEVYSYIERRGNGEE